MSAPPRLPVDFFISRARADAEVARWIEAVLRAAGYTTCSEDAFQPGERILGQINSAIETAERTLLVLSPDFFTSQYATLEYEAAVAANKKLLPVRVRRSEVLPTLQPVIYIDLVDKQGEPAERALLDGLRRASVAPSASVASPPAIAATQPRGPQQISVARLPTASPVLVGRDTELGRLTTAWSDPNVGVVTLVGVGGAGKTSLAFHLYLRGVPGAANVLGWSFSQTGDEDADLFLDGALREWFGEADVPKGSTSRGERLAQLLRRDRSLLILDGLEPLQQGPGPQQGLLKNQGMRALLRELAASNPGLCVCTSRLPITDLEDFVGTRALELVVDNLAPDDGAAYLAGLGVRGDPAELRRASEEFGNHALALTLLGTYLARRRGGDVRQRDTINTLFAAPKGADHARRMLREYETLFRGKPELTVLQVIALFDRSADAEALGELRAAPIPGFTDQLRALSDDQWAEVLEHLSDSRLVSYDDPKGPILLHPLVREHFAAHLKSMNPDAFRASHFRLHQHYSTKAPSLPDSLPAMTPLFYAVYHGCQAERYDEAFRIYLERIERGDDFFLTKRLGALDTEIGLLANFFETRWTTVAAALGDETKARLLGEAGYMLRTVGRLAEAVEPTRAAAEAFRRAGDDRKAAVRFGDVSKLCLALGRIADAIAAAGTATAAADRTGSPELRVNERTLLADAVLQSGDLPKASAIMNEAQALYDGVPNPNPYVLKRYAFRDLALALGRRDEVIADVMGTLQWARASNAPRINVAIDQLVLGRAHPAGSEEAIGPLNAALDALRQLRATNYLILAIMTRAKHYRHTGDRERASRDLDEARRLAQQSGMLLHLTDCHLETAQLLAAGNDFTSARRHCADAQTLIDTTGYHRRDDELQQLQARLVE